MTDRRDNSPKQDGWELPTRRCCGEYSWHVHCGTCGNIAPEKPMTMPDCWLGEN